MKNIITEEMKTRKRAVEYAKKYDNNAAAARKYHTSRQQIARWRARYDGTVESLRSRSTRPKSHPNAHKEEELEIIKNVIEDTGMKAWQKYMCNAKREDTVAHMAQCAK